MPNRHWVGFVQTEEGLFERRTTRAVYIKFINTYIFCFMVAPGVPALPSLSLPSSILFFLNKIVQANIKIKKD